jgi:hypothetical protein
MHELQDDLVRMSILGCIIIMYKCDDVPDEMGPLRSSNLAD